MVYWGRHSCATQSRFQFERLEPRLALAFGLTTTSTTYTVDTGADVVFSVLRQGTSSTIHSGDLTSFKYDGVEFAALYASPGPERYSHFESGLSNDAVVSATVDPQGNWIKIICDDTVATAGSGATGVIQYYIAKKNENTIYMATYAPVMLVSSTRFITYLNWTEFPNHPDASDTSAIHGTAQTAIESTDVYEDPVTGYTHSKYYGETRAIDHVYNAATGPNAGAFMFIGSRESGSGGPFWKDIDFQSEGAAVEMYNIPYSDHSQTDAFRPGLQGPYALVLTNGSAPSYTPDYTFLDGVGLTGWVSPSARGTLTGKATGVPAGHVPTVALSNGTAQYWDTPDASGNYTITGIKPGVYVATLYQDELAVGTQAVTIVAGATTTANIVDTLFLPSSTIFQIGTWDGTPLDFLNADKITDMHPSDPRLSAWAADSTGVTNYIVGTTPDSAWPMAEWKYQTSGSPYTDTDNRITFNLTAAQAATPLTLRIGITRLDHGRPAVSINGAGLTIPPLSAQPDTRGLTLGSWRGNNTLYTYTISTSSLHAGTNTIDITCASGSGSGGQWLSPWFIYDAIDLVPTSSLTNAPKVGSVTIVASNSSVPPNGTQSFVAIAKDQFGNPIPTATQALMWSTTLGTINSQGLYTAGATSGSGTITVSLFDASTNSTKTATINVYNNAAPTITAAASASPNPVSGVTTALSVLGADDGGEGNLTYTWATTGSPPAAVMFSANGTNAAKNVTATFAKAGTYDFQVTMTDAGGLSTSSSVSVTVNQTLTGMTVSPGTASLTSGQTQSFVAAVLDQFGNPLSAQPSLAWSLDAGSVGSINASGLYTAPLSPVGSATVRAASGAISGTATVVVAYLKGDINIDGHRDAGDVISLMRALSDLTSYQTNNHLSDDDLIAIADVNNDGSVTNADLQMLLGLLHSGGGSGSGSLEADAAAPGSAIPGSSVASSSISNGNSDAGDDTTTPLVIVAQNSAAPSQSNQTAVSTTAVSPLVIAGSSVETAALAISNAVQTSLPVEPILPSSDQAVSSSNSTADDLPPQTSSSQGSRNPASEFLVGAFNLGMETSLDFAAAAPVTPAEGALSFSTPKLGTQALATVDQLYASFDSPASLLHRPHHGRQSQAQGEFGLQHPWWDDSWIEPLATGE